MAGQAGMAGDDRRPCNQAKAISFHEGQALLLKKKQDGSPDN
jgi:hypothetical protein